MKFESTEVFNMQSAMKGMRNPLASWDKSDSFMSDCGFILGEKDAYLAVRLAAAGTEHRKYLRQIMVSVDITAPLYWWKEFDTYKVGTVANSTSTMHRIMAKEFTLDMFEFDDCVIPKDLDKQYFANLWITLLDDLNRLRSTYIYYKKEGNDEEAKFYWKELIRILPSAWLQTRTITMSYENLMSMYFQRHNHKLSEWHRYCDWILELPYTQLLFGIG